MTGRPRAWRDLSPGVHRALNRALHTHSVPAAPPASPPPSRPSSRAVVLDAVLVAVASSVVYLLHGFDGTLNRDLGVFTYGGQRLADAGVLPYTGIFNVVGPLADAVPALAIKIGGLLGVGPISSARHSYLVLSVICCVLVAAYGRQLTGSRAAGLLAAGIFLTFATFTHLASDGPREKTVMVLFLLAALLLLGRRRWAAAGVCTALATLAWQPVLLVGLAAAATTVVTTPRELGPRWRAAAAFVLGGAVPPAVVVVVYAVAGHLSWALQGFLLVNAEYTRQTSLYSAPHFVARILWDGYGWSLPVVLAGLVALVVAGIVAVVRGRRDGVIAAAVAAVVGTVWTTTAVNGPPDLFVVLPFAAVGVAIPAPALIGRAAAGVRRPGLGAPVVLVLAAVAVVVAGVSSVATREHGLLLQQRNVHAVLAAAPGASLLSIDAPEVMAISQRVNPTPYQIFNEGIDGYLQHTWPGGLPGLARWMAEQRPTLIVQGLDGQQTWPRPMLARHYVVAGDGPGWRWYVSRAAGPEVLDAVREANRATRGRPTSEQVEAPACSAPSSAPSSEAGHPEPARRPHGRRDGLAPCPPTSSSTRPSTRACSPPRRGAASGRSTSATSSTSGRRSRSSSPASTPHSSRAARCRPRPSPCSGCCATSRRSSGSGTGSSCRASTSRAYGDATRCATRTSTARSPMRPSSPRHGRRGAGRSRMRGRT